MRDLPTRSGTFPSSAHRRWPKCVICVSISSRGPANRSNSARRCPDRAGISRHRRPRPSTNTWFESERPRRSPWPSWSRVRPVNPRTRTIRSAFRWSWADYHFCRVNRCESAKRVKNKLESLRLKIVSIRILSLHDDLKKRWEKTF